MIVNFLVRQGWSVEKALRIFAEHRPPGIYKEDYIRELYRYNHEPLCAPASFLHPFNCKHFCFISPGLLRIE